jgi:NAD(P)H-flavin reductase
MNDYQSALLDRTQIAESTVAFRFEKPKHFVFKAGQYIDLTLYYIAGPPTMVTAARQILVEVVVDEDDIRTKELLAIKNHESESGADACC